MTTNKPQRSKEGKAPYQKFGQVVTRALFVQAVLSVLLWFFLGNQSFLSLKIIYGYVGMVSFALVGILVMGRWASSMSSQSEVLRPSLERDAQDMRQSFQVTKQVMPYLTASMIAMIVSSL